MRIAIMQPYLFPYLGYFQLMDAADKFFLLDDVNFIKRGWVNRNNILLDHKPYRFTLPLHSISQNKKIKDISIAIDDKWRRKFMTTLHFAYHKSPYYHSVADLIKEIIYSDESILSGFIANSLEKISIYIGTENTIITISSTANDDRLKGQDRILSICANEHAQEYINLPGGRKLYDAAEFKNNSILLSFLDPHLNEYPQQNQKIFIPGLSIIDVLMNNSKEIVKEMIHQYGISEG